MGEHVLERHPAARGHADEMKARDAQMIHELLELRVRVATRRARRRRPALTDAVVGDEAITGARERFDLVLEQQAVAAAGVQEHDGLALAARIEIEHAADRQIRVPFRRSRR